MKIDLDISINRNKVEFAMRNALMNTLTSTDQEIPFILHCIKDTTIIGNMPLQAATNLCTNFPILVIGISDNILNGRCCVPEVNNNYIFCYIIFYLFVKYFETFRKNNTLCVLL